MRDLPAYKQFSYLYYIQYMEITEKVAFPWRSVYDIIGVNQFPQIKGYRLS